LLYFRSALQAARRLKVKFSKLGFKLVWLGLIVHFNYSSNEV